VGLLALYLLLGARALKFIEEKSMFRGAKKTIVMLGVAAALSMSGKAAFALTPQLTDGNSSITFNPTTSAVSWIVDGVDQYGGSPAGSNTLEYFNGTSFVPLLGLTVESSSLSGNIGSATFGGTLGNDNFTITVKAILTGGAAGSGASGINETITVNNLGPTTTDTVSPAVPTGTVDFIIRNTVDANLNATPNDDTLTLSPSGAPNTAVQTDPTGVKLTYSSTPTPSQFALIDGGSSSTNLGPATGNEAFQFNWDLSLASGDTGIISITQALSGPTQMSSVAAPNSAWSALVALAGLGIFSGIRRMRRAII
jgi:hypothetical protein